MYGPPVVANDIMLSNDFILFSTKKSNDYYLIQGMVQNDMNQQEDTASSPTLPSSTWNPQF
jgi:cAMP phosphodiesterase